MENLPERHTAKSVAIELYNPTPETKAIEVRRKMVQLPEVAKALTSVEKFIFAASTKTQIKDIDTDTLVEKLSILLKYISMDIGYNIPQDIDDWNFIQTRILDILTRYFSELTLSEVKLAFELATTGELDAYLLKDSQGNPDRKHYQNLNAEYISKILNAYRKKQSDVFDKAYKALPSCPKEITKEEKAFYENIRIQRNRYLFLLYKYTGQIRFELSDEIFLYKWLYEAGFAEYVKATQEDKKEAYNRFLKRVSNGFVNEYKAFNVRRQGIESPELSHTAYEVARRKEIIKAFDRMIAEEIQVDNYLIYE